MLKKVKLTSLVFLVGMLFFPFVCLCDEPVTFDEIGDISAADLDALEQRPDFSQYVLRLTPEQIEKLLALLVAIERPLWKNTLIPKGRDPLYLLPYKITALEYGGVATSLFFNMTDKMPVRASSLLVEKIDEKKLSDFVNTLFQTGNGVDLSAQEFSSLVPLFQKITLQERRAGFFLQGGFVKGPFNVQLNTLCQVAERNFWLNKRDRAEATTIIQKKFPDGSFDDKELYRITYGLGDTRVKCGLNTLNMTDFVVDFGFEGIVPTSRIASKRHMTTVVDIQLEDEQVVKDTVTNLLRGARDLLLDPKLGNGGHFGVGCYLESKIGLFNRLANMWLRLSYNKLFVNDEYRLIMFKNTIGKLTDYPGGPKADVISKFFREFAFPSSFKTSVNPGSIFNAIASISFDVKKLNIALGYDFYAQQRERIEKIYSPSIQMSELRVEDAEIPDIYQHKIFSEALYTRKYKRYKMGVGLGGDVTVYSKNLGYDWTVYLKATASF